VARADAGVDTEREAAGEAALGESVDGVACAHDERRLGRRVEHVVEVLGRRVDRGVMYLAGLVARLQGRNTSPAAAHSALAPAWRSVRRTAPPAFAFTA